ncbi:DUF4230 domain-containing protein [Pinibacter aurantiacus]|uniref:DUF4230 domain-containing protein n=1 Tax=Pinibacter aurantiacus TaxID=2851599 RepID=A0A9E2S8L8_9BACT|nr:DUF4230 domain-containing protein [Pinibacter aurantiacus]MBV4356902.1 DUF4230 domain-containing protein [Pinibacter aurantiacus]
MIKSIRNIVITVLLVIVLVFVLRKLDVIPSFQDVFAPKPVVIDNTPILIKDIKQISQLFTITVYDEVVMDSTKYAQQNVISKILQYAVPGTVPTGFATVVLVAKGKVIAGTDLQKITDKDVFVEKDSVSLQLPQAQILDVIVNPSDVSTFSETGDWLPDEITQVKSRIKNKLVQRALAQDVINKANTQGIAIMENFLRTVGYKKVVVRVANN